MFKNKFKQCMSLQLFMLMVATVTLIVSCQSLREAVKQGKISQGALENIEKQTEISNIFAVTNLYVNSLPFYGLAQSYIALKKFEDEIKDEKTKKMTIAYIKAIQGRYLEFRTDISNIIGVPCSGSEPNLKCDENVSLDDLFSYLKNYQNKVISAARSAWILGHKKDIKNDEKEAVLKNLKAAINDSPYLVIKYMAIESYKKLTPELQWGKLDDLLDYENVLNFIGD